MVTALAKVATNVIKKAPEIKPKPTALKGTPSTSNPAAVNKNLTNNPLASKATGNASGPPPLLPPRKPIPDKSQANLDLFNKTNPPGKPTGVADDIKLGGSPKVEVPPRSKDTLDLIPGKPVPPKGEFIPEGKLWSKNLESKMPQTPKSGWQNTKDFVTSPLGGALTGTVGGSLLVMGGTSAYQKMKGNGGEEAVPADGSGAADPAATGSADSAGGYGSYDSSYDPYNPYDSFSSGSTNSGYGTGYGSNSFYA